MLIDTHCQLQFFSKEQRREICFQLSRQKSKVINSTTKLEDFDEVAVLAIENSWLWMSLGVHPTEAKNIKNCEDLESCFASYLHKQELRNKIVAIGETGLDYFHVQDEAEQKLQREVFIKQLEIAAKYDKPVVIHSRNTHEETYQILESKQVSRFEMHFFQGSPKQADKFMALGGYLAFSFPVTFTDSYDQTISHVPLDRILLETDAPFVRQNSPLDISSVYDKVAMVKGIKSGELEKAMEQNVRNFFGINNHAN